MRRFEPSEIEKLRLMAEVGHSGLAIARSLGRTPQSIRVKCVELGIRLRPRKAKREVRFVLEDQDHKRLSADADAQGITVARLCQQLLHTIAHDGLTAAVLDLPPTLAVLEIRWRQRRKKQYSLNVPVS